MFSPLSTVFGRYKIGTIVQTALHHLSRFFTGPSRDCCCPERLLGGFIDLLRSFVAVAVLVLLICERSSGLELSWWPEEVEFEQQQVGTSRLITEMAPAGETEQATFAAGCFWSVELAFQRVPGVTKTAVGYTQGHTVNPTYEQVCGGRTGHAEAVLVDYNPSEASYDQLLDVFWKKHDPTQHNRQGNDVGTQYRSGIYYHTPEQETASRASLKAMETKLGKKIATEVLPAKSFYPAEAYHQQYLEKGTRGGGKQSARKGCNDPIRCYG